MTRASMLLLTITGFAAGCGEALPAVPATFLAMTFNAGTNPGMASDGAYTAEMEAVVDEHYENSLSWNPAEQALAEFVRTRRPDVVAFQEIFWDGWCEQIPVEEHAGLDLVCRDHDPSGPTQPQRLLGSDFQVMCAPGKPDVCLGVRKAFGRFRGCAGDYCFDGLEGLAPPGDCGSKVRISSALVDLTERYGGGELVVVSVYGRSGFNERDRTCRVGQFEQIFLDRGDGRPAAFGGRNLILGDFNTDPGRFGGMDESAAFLAEQVAFEPTPGRRFHFVSEVGERAPFTYKSVAAIDHVITDALAGRGCVSPGVTEGERPVLDVPYWDHVPVICALEIP